MLRVLSLDLFELEGKLTKALRDAEQVGAKGIAEWSRKELVRVREWRNKISKATRVHDRSGD